MTTTIVTQLTLSVKQGEVFDIPFEIKADGVAVDLTGASILFEVKKTPLVSANAIISKSITENSDIDTIGRITYPESGKFQVHLSSIDTSYAPYDYYLIITLNINDQEDIISSIGNRKAVYRICTQ